MKISTSLGTGFRRTLKTKKSILIAWFCILILVLVFAFPLRSSLRSAFGSSMITEKFTDGMNIEAFTDLGPAFKSLMSFFTAGFLFTFLAGFLLNAFLTAGLFGSVKKDDMKFSSREFFSSAAGNFPGFLLISLILSLIIDALFLLIIVLPAGIASVSETISDSNIFIILVIAGTIYLLILPVMFLVVDYARAFKTAREDASLFGAIGKGFSFTFSNFRKSYGMMLLLVLAQIALGIVVMLILPGWKPGTGGGVFLLLIVSQLLFILRLFLKTWRYASVTSMMNEMMPGDATITTKENI